ncbi:GDSL-like Lipase/Acylhydrolase family protein [Nocardioides alpinus]|uniref:GDSL-like Lipase/Acylhydrolase family protein n=1 Tax=Nocardioides alpinus TaxID=748909 RepID=A0A1I0WCC3_9ACTN|nr:SGNH/GDSL hydrolase family protein [Nocardioides alpinus]PKH37840.1 SGNH/GDSL hydrolase family protein [Nocardioides alpinus]SFA86405.1 GDSL-like Lipase/Acylhydrolase family protein [Nocardioides alpinus]
MTPRPLSLIGSLLATAAIVTTGLAGPAPAASTTHVLDGLGDSYASGYGVAPSFTTPCGRADSAPAPAIDGRMRLALDDFVACAGARTTDLVPQGQIAALGSDTDVVTLSIGGNDIGWSQAVGACLAGSDAQCTGALAQTRARITTQLPGLLDSAYDQVDAAAPAAAVYVTGYPRLFSSAYGAVLGASPIEQDALNEGADLLNATIRTAAEAHGYTFVDLTKRFADHGVNAPEPWLIWPTSPGSFHPNEPGYEAYAAAVTAAIRPSALR